MSSQRDELSQESAEYAEYVLMACEENIMVDGVKGDADIKDDDDGESAERRL